MQIKRIMLVGLLLAGLFILEPVLRNKAIFAVPFFSHNQVNYEKAQELVSQELFSQTRGTQKGHAPEPAAMVLFLGGIGGIMLRYVRFGFAKIKRAMDLALSVIGLTVTGALS